MRCGWAGGMPLPGHYSRLKARGSEGNGALILGVCCVLYHCVPIIFYICTLLFHISPCTEKVLLSRDEMKHDKRRPQIALGVLHWPHLSREGKKSKPLLYSNYIYYTYSLDPHPARSTGTTPRKYKAGNEEPAGESPWYNPTCHVTPGHVFSSLRSRFQKDPTKLYR